MTTLPSVVTTLFGKRRSFLVNPGADPAENRERNHQDEGEADPESIHVDPCYRLIFCVRPWPAKDRTILQKSRPRNGGMAGNLARA